jgi:cell surface protein SprA
VKAAKPFLNILLIALAGTAFLAFSYTESIPQPLSNNTPSNQTTLNQLYIYNPIDSPVGDTLPFPFGDRQGDFYNNPDNNPINLNDPNIIDKTIIYDPVTGEFKVVEKIGNFNYRDPSYVSFQDFLNQQYQNLNEDYWKQRSDGVDLLGRSQGIKLKLGKDPKKNGPFGSNVIEIKPKGNIELIMGGQFQNIENPTLPKRAQKQGGFDFDMNINMSISGKIGDKLKLNTVYNTKAVFDFENQIKLNFEGSEDEILQAIEAGNVNFPLSSSLITGSQNLFGIKTRLKFGRLTVTSVLSQQKAKRENIKIEGGAQSREFEISGFDYDENRHFFLSQYFRDNYERFLQTMPLINSPVNITRIEVWVTNTTLKTQNNRDIVGFMDLAEPKRIYNPSITPNPNLNIPANEANSLFNNLLNTPGTRSLNTVITTLQSTLGLTPISEFEKTRAIKLDPTEFTLFPMLGFISLNKQLKPDEVLAVAFEYTYQGKVYRVGEFTQDLPTDPNESNVMFLKLLKSTSQRPKLPIWDLMMKNIYALGAYQVNNEDFKLDIYYQDPGGGLKRYIPEGTGVKSKPIIRLLKLDQLNNQLDPMPDGIFDFVSGVTINPGNGRVIFPVVEPFGEFLSKEFIDNGNPANLAEKYVFQNLYDSTKTIALQNPEFDRFVIKGNYKSSVSSEIYLGAFNIPKGSVTVTAGGQRLKEGIDYTIDYNLGRVKIINDGILNSGVPINVSFENNAFFGIQTKTMIGNRLDYWVNDNLTIGSTQMLLYERPFTQKVNFGDDPIRNSMYGLDVKFDKELKKFTEFLDNLPIIETKESSQLNVYAEGALFKPGHSKAINQGNKGGYVYLDDFEGSKSTYDLKFPYTSWSLSSTPKGATDFNGKVLFPEAELYDSLAYGYNRAKLAWYTLDPVFQSNNSGTPQYIKDNPDLQSNHYVRIIEEKEIFERDNPNLLFTQLSTFDLQYRPSLRGPYNYLSSKFGLPGIADGINKDGSLKRPETRWGGIMRDLITTDFEQANIEYIDFWVMDPFDNRQGNGELYINLGNVSEDVLKDSRKFFENGLPRPNVQPRLDSTNWGVIPKNQPITNAFDTDPAVLLVQDKGFDGLSSSEEAGEAFFKKYLDDLNTMFQNGDLTDSALQAAIADPSTDDFVDYLDEALDNEPLTILERYLKFDGAEGNTSANVTNGNNQFSHGSNLPNTEDLNQDNTLNETEEYYQYRIPLYDGMTVENHPFITDIVNATATFKNGQTDDINWYHFRIPIDGFNKKVGGIQDFRSIRFIRMFLTGFDQPVVMRFARLDLVRNQWRRYKLSLLNPGEYLANDDNDQTIFNVGAVNVEDNSKKDPVPYMLPPGVEREQFVGNNTGSVFLQNEQSMQLEVCGLEDGDSRAVFKNLSFDVRQYDRLELFFHAESYTGKGVNIQPLKDDEMVAILRLGDDFTENYYEFAIPLKVTKPEDVNGTELQRREAIWPLANKMDIRLDSLILAKELRFVNSGDPTVPYTIDAGKGRTITVIGNPNLGMVKIAMIGIKNPKDGSIIGAPICGEIWVNEMRLSGLNQDAGTAALIRSDLKMADIGTISLAGSYHSIGFGQIEQKVNERFLDNFLQYDFSTNLNLGKLLPKSVGIRLPMYAGISESFSEPKYDPYDLDILVKDKLKYLQGSEKQEYLRNIRDMTSIKSLNFTNISKNKSRKGSSKIYDISNLNLTYAYTNSVKKSPIIEYDIVKRRKLGLGYNYSTKANYISPFKKMIGNSKWLRLIKDINFNLLPNRLSFRTEMNRQYGETVLRDIYGDAQIDTTYNKFYNWDRFYDLRWDLTKSLKIDFSAVNNARIDEPEGRIDSKVKKDSIWTNIKNFGRNTSYRHNLTINYNIPFSKLPITDWINSRISYATDYEWITAPLNLDTLGNTIRNSRSIRFNVDGNLTSLYNKVGFIKRANQRSSKTKGKKPREKGQKENTKPKNEEKDKDKKGAVELSPGIRTLIGFVTGIKRISFNYNRTQSTYLPGYTQGTNILGMDNNGSPGFGFVFGYQPDTNDLNAYANNQWFTNASSFNYQMTQTLAENYDIKITVEPFKDMRIDITLKRTYSQDYAEIFKFDPAAGKFVHLNPLLTGSYNLSYWALRTTFNKIDSTGLSETYRQFEKNRAFYSQRLGAENPYSNGIYIHTPPGDTNAIILPEYADGYGPYSQDVLIPAFIAAYTGKDPKDIKFQPLVSKPKPNWRFTYNGLSKLGNLSKIFQTFNITHAYSSSMVIANFQSDYNYGDPNKAGFPGVKDTVSGSFYTFFNSPRIIISEQFGPLIGIDITLVSGLTAKFDYKIARNIALSLVDYQMIEGKTSEVTLGIGYRVRGMKLPFKVKGREARLKNDLTFKFDFSLRDDKTVQYQFDQNNSEPTQGALSYSISPSIDYVINNRLNIRLFYDHKRTKPHTSISYPISNTNFGIAVRFTLAE